MEAIGIVRNLDQLGRVVLAKEMRDMLNINTNDGMEIFTEDNCIILKKYEPLCIFCGDGEDISFFKGKKICCTCKNELSRY